MAQTLILDSSSDPLTEELSLRQPAAGPVPGNMAIWVGILSEMTEFALMFVVYFIAKVHHPAIFNQGPTQLNTTAGTVNTLALLTSSYFVARGVSAIRQGRLKQCERWLWGAVGMAILYLLVKYYEYHWNSAQGLGVDTNLFFGVYYYTTFNHLLHVGWGGAAIVWAIFRLRAGAFDQYQHDTLEAVAVYWHMIDLAWLVLFPLLYVLR